MILTELRPYQDQAVRTASAYDGFCLFPEQRTGKCLISLALVDRFKPDAVVIICPKKALKTWEKEIVKHLELDWECEIFIVTYQEPVKDIRLRRHYYKWSKDFVADGNRLMVIADEAHYIKKAGTAQSKFTRTLGKRAQVRLALTGTPTDKAYEEFWPIYDFIQHGIAFPSTYEGFKSMYMEFDEEVRRDGRKYPVIVGYKHMKVLLEIIHKYSYRVTFNEARRSMGKKPVRIQRKKAYFDLDKHSKELYREMDKEMEVTIRGLRITTPLPVTKLQKLQQICGGFLLHQQRIPGQKKKRRMVVQTGDEKMTKLMQLLSGPVGNSKAVICCRFTHEIKAIAEKFDEFNWTYKIIDGQNEWDHKFDVDYVILQVKSGLGFDLSEANTYIFYSWDHSHITFDQARFRIMNMEHTELVKYYFLIARDTIEEEYYEAVKTKKDFSTLVLDRYRKKKTQKRSRADRTDSGRVRRTYKGKQAA